jgi:hypothetical protein
LASCFDRRQDPGDAPLIIEGRKSNLVSEQVLPAEILDVGSLRHVLNSVAKSWMSQCNAKIARIDLLLIGTNNSAERSTASGPIRSQLREFPYCRPTATGHSNDNVPATQPLLIAYSVGFDVKDVRCIESAIHNVCGS